MKMVARAECLTGLHVFYINGDFDFHRNSANSHLCYHHNVNEGMEIQTKIFAQDCTSSHF